MGCDIYRCLYAVGCADGFTFGSKKMMTRVRVHVMVAEE